MENEMNVEVVIQDLKGITEYSKEEKEREEIWLETDGILLWIMK